MKALDRTGLIELVAGSQELPPAVRRSVLAGKVEVLGAFGEGDEAILPDSRWMMTIITRHGVIWHVAVRPTNRPDRFRVSVADSIPWHLWLGSRIAREGSYSVYLGDHPATYEARRDLARQRRDAREHRLSIGLSRRGRSPHWSGR